MRRLTTYAVTFVIVFTSFLSSTRMVWADQATSAPPEGITPSATSTNDDKWTFTAPLYVWAAGLTGNVNVQGNTVRVDLPFTDLMDHANLGFMGYLQLAKPQYGFYSNPNYESLTFDGKFGPGARASLDVDLWIVENVGFFRIWELTGVRPAALYVLGGARYWNVHSNLSIKTGVGSATTATTSWLLDPMVGFRFTEDITKRVHILGQTDVGGFDICNNTSRFSWQLIGTVGYDFTMPVFKKPSTVFAGWRQINVQKTIGSQSGINLNLSGVVLGVYMELF